MNSCIRSISSEGGPGGRRGSRGRARAQDRRTGARSRAAVGARACVVDRRAAALGQSLDGLESHEGFDAAEGVDLPSARGNVVSIRLAQGRPPSIGSARAATVVVGGEEERQLCGGLSPPLTGTQETTMHNAQCTMHRAVLPLSIGSARAARKGVALRRPLSSSYTQERTIYASRVLAARVVRRAPASTPHRGFGARTVRPRA